MSSTTEGSTAAVEGLEAASEVRSHPEASKRRALGRGLESLLPSRSSMGAAVVPVVQAANSEQPGYEEGGALEIPLEKIDRNPFQTRTQFDEGKLAELAASIVATGVVQPILVRPLREGRYQLIAGERRWLASKIAAKATIPAIVRHVSDEQAMEMTIVENLQRADLNAMEQARAYERLMREFKMTQEQMSLRTGKDRTSISNFLRLLRMPHEVQAYIESGHLTLGHAKALMGLDSAEVTVRAAHKVAATEMSVRQTELYVQSYMKPRLHSERNTRRSQRADPNVYEVQDQLQQALGLRVWIEDKEGRGKVIIEYSRLDDFDIIVAALTGKPR